MEKKYNIHFHPSINIILDLVFAFFAGAAAGIAVASSFAVIARFSIAQYYFSRWLAVGQI